MKTITSKDPIGSLIDNIKWNMCPKCGKGFVLVVLILRNPGRGEQHRVDVFNISEKVYCPDCSPGGNGWIELTSKEKQIKRKEKKMGRK